MDDVIICKTNPDDILILQEIARRTFYEAFSSSNSEQDMGKYLEEGFSQIRLSAELNNPNSEFYFAISGDDIIGYLKVNTGEAQTDIKEDNALEVERIYLLKEFHGRKVGQLLLDKALDIARQRGAKYIWLGVWENNARAISFYKKNGFVEFGKHSFLLGDDEQTDILMKLVIN